MEYYQIVIHAVRRLQKRVVIYGMTEKNVLNSASWRYH